MSSIFSAGSAGTALNFLKGQVMRLSKGKANPALAGEISERNVKGKTKPIRAAD
jgi:aspartyl-tRNA(Asn)/glutamyl-tRNA(Gln) amidotransferase subunit B